LNLVQRLYRPADDASRRAGAEPDWVSVLYHGAGETTDYGLKPVATPSATLALVGGPSSCGTEHDAPVVSLMEDDHDDLVERGEPMRVVDAAANPFDVLASSLRDYLGQIETTGRVVVRFDGSAVEFVLEPQSAHAERSDAA
jgi:hypothetical protein